MQDISRQTGIQVSFIQSWFWMSRALANLFDEEKADKEELVREFCNLYMYFALSITFVLYLIFK